MSGSNLPTGVDRPTLAAFFYRGNVTGASCAVLELA